MIVQVYSVRDRKADTFGRPIFAPNLGVLVRDIQEVLRTDSQSTMSRFPHDFQLYRLGDFDDHKGQFVLEPLPDLVLEVASLMPEGHAATSGAGAGVVPPNSSEANGSALA